MRSLVTFLLLLFSVLVNAQAEPVPDVPNDKNWISSISYNFSGVTISKGVSFYNDLGKATQQQSWDALTHRIWASETRYDSFGRVALQTLSAPFIETSNFGYRTNFLLSNGASINLSQYDTSATLFNPPTISSQANSLGWYYSSSNTLDPYQDVTSYPYSRTIYSDLNPGSVKAVLGGNKINNQWLQSYAFSMAAESYPNTNNPRKTIKSVSRGVDGIETVAFSDTDGNLISTARSGNEANAALAQRDAYSEILYKGFVDIHIPVGCGGTVTITGINSSNHLIKIYNLISEEQLSVSTTPSYTNNASSVVLPAGFYRFEDANNYYGNNNTTSNVVTPIRINYKVNYYDYAVNQYDYADRLIATVQPLNPQLVTTFDYNTLGQVISSTSPDEGTAHFRYRNDGQIRFSQNSEQVKNNSFSYTNYDQLGRPVESGVYKGDEIFFNNISNPNLSVDAIINDLDGLPLEGRQEQNFSVYDIADANLAIKLEQCRLPSQEYKQSFISSNISYTYNQNPYTTKTWYSYDVYGRVKWIIQEIPGLGCLKTIDYSYDPVDGQLVLVDYQRHDPTERFIHKYNYNVAGQLIDVYTSLNNVNFTKQAHYIYNESGALTRTELAQNLQGIDYTYNLSGQLKAINHPSILPNQDPGADGTAGSAFAADVFGMALDYYNGDYTRTNTPKPITSTPNGTDQYNGNIKATRWNTQLPNSNHSAYTYQYNKNNWLTEATFGQAISNPASNLASINPNTNADYKVSNITYDANGNIKTLNRNGYTDSAGTNNMDNLVYNYQSGTASANRLISVKDNLDNIDPNRYNDIKDQQVTVATGGSGLGGITPTISLDNYIYNDLGQLKINIQDKVMYDYTSSGLVDKISSFADSTNTDDYKTIFFDNYNNFTTSNHGWSNVGGLPSHVFGLGFSISLSDYCQELQEQELYQNTALQINGKKTVRKQFRVTPNTTFRINFDLILDKLLSNETDLDPIGGPGNTTPVNIPIEPSVIIKLRKADGTVFHTQTINSQTAEYCNRYFDQHLTHTFTTGNDETFSLDLEILNNFTGAPGGLPGSTSYEANNYQKTYLDNLHLEVATSVKVAFFYNDKGHRVRKVSYLSNGSVNTTFYVRDASGNTMAVYNGTSSSGARTAPPRINEHTIYGSGRIGIFKRDNTAAGGYALYQLTDHLGNVRAVLKKTGAATYAITTKTDYYPFGMPMPNKHTTDNNYRYAFQGQEKDPETEMEAFELRLWDGRLGRWLTVDPYHEFHSPYIGMGNNPISLIDPDGGMTDGGGDPEKKGFLGRLWDRISNAFSSNPEDTMKGGVLDEVHIQGAAKKKASIFSGIYDINPFHTGSGENREFMHNLSNVTNKYGDNLQNVRTGLEHIPFMDAFFALGIDNDPGKATILLSLNFIPVPRLGTVAAKEGLPIIKKAVNSNLPHAIYRGVERGVFGSKAEASTALKNLTSSISKNGFPSGSILDPSYADRVLVPIGNGGLVSYQVAKNGTASIKTVLIAK